MSVARRSELGVFFRTTRAESLSFGFLVSLIPRILILVLLISVLVGFWVGLTSPPRTAEYHDFRRIVSEYDLLATGRIDETIEVPKTKDVPLQLVEYPAGKGERCMGLACLCVIYKKGDRLVEECKQYPSIVSECIDPQKTCISKITHIVIPKERTSVKLTRSGNEIYVT